LREEVGHGENGQFRKAWFAFQNQSEFAGTYPYFIARPVATEPSEQLGVRK
jgi:hypothetical protein